MADALPNIFIYKFLSSISLSVSLLADLDLLKGRQIVYESTLNPSLKHRHNLENPLQSFAAFFYHLQTATFRKAHQDDPPRERKKADSLHKPALKYETHVKFDQLFMTQNSTMCPGWQWKDNYTQKGGIETSAHVKWRQFIDILCQTFKTCFTLLPVLSPLCTFI